MRLNPRYEGPPVLVLEPAVDPSIPLFRQRRRLADTLATFDDAQWAAPTRCAGWSARDVISHLVTTNSFWATSMAAGRAGQPTRILPGFDPAVTPAQLVEASPVIGTNELLGRFITTNHDMERALDGLDADGWRRMAEAPAGHIALSAVASHALWDSWVHERDICLPLGLPVDVEPDEVAVSLRYAVGLGPAFLATEGSTRSGAFALSVTHPDATIVVEVGRTVVVRDADSCAGLATLEGEATALTEAFSCRGGLPSLPDEERWMIDALAVAFDQVS
ncbi:MAG TPA: maleylpyruvate isomerase family mycothiol-dependent enzyme [Acidimicrobiales bacterium]